MLRGEGREGNGARCSSHEMATLMTAMRELAWLGLARVLGALSNIQRCGRSKLRAVLLHLYSLSQLPLGDLDCRLWRIAMLTLASVAFVTRQIILIHLHVAYSVIQNRFLSNSAADAIALTGEGTLITRGLVNMPSATTRSSTKRRQ